MTYYVNFKHEIRKNWPEQLQILPSLHALLVPSLLNFDRLLTLEIRLIDKISDFKYLLFVFYVAIMSWNNRKQSKFCKLHNHCSIVAVHCVLTVVLISIKIFVNLTLLWILLALFCSIAYKQKRVKDTLSE